MVSRFCKRGHDRSLAPMISLRDTGTIIIRCRTCHNARTNASIKLRYRHDTAFRKRVSARSLAYYHAHKESINARV